MADEKTPARATAPTPSPGVAADEWPEQDGAVWVMSNRMDDRVILFERDISHPGGECFLGGAGVDYCAKTPAVERLLMSGEAIEVPKPVDGRKRPRALDNPLTDTVQAMPGQPARLGRAADPELFGPGGERALAEARKGKPKQIDVPAGVIVPPAPPAAR